jgi:chitinase
MRLRKLLPAVALAAAVGLAVPLTSATPADAADSQRVVVYYQTQFNDGTYVSPKGLTDHNAGVTDIITGAIHLNDDGSVTLNDTSPDDARFGRMWSDLGDMHGKGVHVLGMVGGAAAGSFKNLDSDFDTYYPKLKDVITKHHLDGVDLDVEEQMSLPGVEKLIDKLHSDFGAGFVVTLAPVATALKGGGNLSGFSYDDLYRDRGPSISWFNTQFYCGWGSLDGTADYDGVIDHGVVPASKVVAGTITNPADCGSGYVPMDKLKSTVSSLTGTYDDFGGVSAWEYFNSDPGGTSAPWEWAADMSSSMKKSATAGR